MLLNESATSFTDAGDLTFTGKESFLGLLESLGKAVAVGAEAGEDVDEISTGNVGLKVQISQLQQSYCGCMFTSQHYVSACVHHHRLRAVVSEDACLFCDPNETLVRMPQP